VPEKSRGCSSPLKRHYREPRRECQRPPAFQSSNHEIHKTHEKVQSAIEIRNPKSNLELRNSGKRIQSEI
jgi:hypothetical protein